MNGIQEVSGSIPLISTKTPASIEAGVFCLYCPRRAGAALRFGHALARLTASPWGALCRDETAAFAAF